jgi:hypothetical protein
MKSTINDGGTATHLHYPLSRKNYDEMIVTDVLVPRVLVVVLVPDDVDHWIELSVDQLSLKRCAYWACLKGLQPSDNDTSVTVHVPRSNLFDTDALRAMMARVNNGEPL